MAAADRQILLDAGRILAVRAKHLDEASTKASTDAQVDHLRELSRRAAEAAATCLEEVQRMPAESVPAPRDTMPSPAPTVDELADQGAG